MNGARLRALTEAMVLLGLGFWCLVEGRRVVLYKQPFAVHQEQVSPGVYVLILGCALLIACVLHVIANRARIFAQAPVNEQIKVAPKIRRTSRTAVSMFLALAGYVFLVDTVNYVLATAVFFALAFRIAGITSWLTIVSVSAGISLLFHLVFVVFGGLIFPRGVLSF